MSKSPRRVTPAVELRHAEHAYTKAITDWTRVSKVLAAKEHDIEEIVGRIALARVELAIGEFKASAEALASFV